MRSSLALPSGRLSFGRAVGGVAGVAAAVLAGWLLVAASRLGFRMQVLLVAALVGVPVGVYLYLTKPHVVMNAYVFVLPFLVSDPEGGVNVGEILSVGVVAGGLPLLVLGHRPVTGPIRKVALAFLALAALGAISVYANSVVTLPNVANGVVKYFVFAAAAALLYAFTDDETKAQRLMKTLVWSAAGVALYSIFEYATGRSYFPEYGYSRASGTFEHWNQLGGYMALVSFPTIMYAVRSKTPWARLGYVGAWAAELVALLLSLTLGAMLGVAVGALAGAVLYFRRGVLKTLAATLAGVAILGAVWQTVPEVREKFEAADTRTEDRLATYITGAYALRDNFWIGVGAQDELLDAVLTSNRRGPSVSVVPHNAFLAIGVEKGILGSVLLIVVVVAALRTVVGKRNLAAPANRLLVYGAGMGSIAFLTQNMTNLLLLHVRLGIVWIAFHVAAARLSRAPEPRDA
ncbi:MAG TPA: O-antigen ligase family protein [Actinomycetota bacterium]|nr:O-antigen ligase family protein [Actinomycetota bacterium]